MKDFVSGRWLAVFALLSALSAAVFASANAWTLAVGALAGLSVLLGALHTGLRTIRTTRQVIDDVEAEPVPRPAGAAL